MLEVDGLTKRYGTLLAAHQVSFRLQAGEAFGLLGPNGAGKSTTISMLTGLVAPDSGDVTLDGRRLSRDPRYVKQHVGLVPQNIALYNHMTAEENLRFWGAVYGIRGQKLRDNMAWCLRVAGLDDHRRQLVKRFSGGMQRRLNIAVAMIHRPDILVMDEPTVGIDPQSRNHILETVRDLNRDGMTVIYTSHYMEEVQYLCKRLAIMDAGEVIAYGDLEDVRQLAGSLATVTLEVSGDATSAMLELQQDISLTQLDYREGRLSFRATDAAAAVGRTVLTLSRHPLQLMRIDVQEPNLETAFLHLTGKKLRDSGGGAMA